MTGPITEIYRLALAEGRDPYEAVAQAYDMSKTEAKLLFKPFETDLILERFMACTEPYEPKLRPRAKKRRLLRKSKALK